MAKRENTSTVPVHIMGLFLLFTATFLFLSLVSFSPEDPGFTLSRQTDTFHNWMGFVGSYIADGLYIVFGVWSFALPLFMIDYAYRYCLRKNHVNWLHIASTAIIMFAVLGMLHIFFPKGISLFSTTIKAGGVVGRIIGESLVTYLNYWGSLVLLIMLLAGGVMMGYDLAASIRSIRDLFVLAREKGLLQRKRKEPVERLPQARTSRSPSPKTRAGRETGGGKEPRITMMEHEGHDISEVPRQATLDFVDNYQFPPLSLLSNPPSKSRTITEKELKANASLILSKLRDFGVEGEILEIKPGPVITMFEFTPAPGIKINKIVSLADDLAMALKAAPVRVVAPIPGKNAVGIEIPNRSREIVSLRRILASKEFTTSNAPLTLALGTDIEGTPVVTNLSKMPHLLIAGATGTGKSVGLNTMILSLLYKNNPSELKFIMIDPKRIELSHYEGIPHLLHPVVIDPREALPVLKWAVAEMELRYALFKDHGVKGIDSYNKKVKKDDPEARTTLASIKGDDSEPGLLPKVVVVIDEMADLMMVNREVEVFIARLAQMARAAGIYMIVATQRPSVDVITGLIKSNFPSRISFRVSSKIDSRTILDSSGADQLLGLGDMLFLSPGTTHLKRVHGAYVSEEELDKVIDFIREQKGPDYVKEVDTQIAELARDESDQEGLNEEYDPVYDEALEFVTSKGSASISLIQRRFRIGYNRAARIIEQMETEGILGPADAAGKPRKVLVKSYARELEE
ncbi:MAG TPA: DNA translocase FtsK 4TM domain-containing protein [Deltaproteobacteria bacterium]|jgi:S-DNA-T family DNA segregation ATPase FtsK/SpoIIIE|nr:DNA translocase FtsK 4TM domain-containing protein [Deltaproteobacteria bacterium]OQC23391.1 MAG: DNA translocase FtsK [Deltaproteobacteria bacterium ADurb.Bin072]HRW79398.1 DNA translocase FtsK 4TM domain-containing protein [Desulfomonilia bacterium]NMD41374.1 DNA translocase FtsK [Deltaproteobacteria bacterium]HNQ85500.1 DNA translocase FtsK 4TM domain-containing protein [Deltaproteobacteria bacterium]